MSEVTQAAATAERNNRKTREGLVVSNKMDKTAVVAVVERVRHPKYGKFMMRTKKLYVHDETNDVNMHQGAGRYSPALCRHRRHLRGHRQGRHPRRRGEEG